VLSAGPRDTPYDGGIFIVDIELGALEGIAVPYLIRVHDRCLSERVYYSRVTAEARSKAQIRRLSGLA